MDDLRAQANLRARDDFWSTERALLAQLGLTFDGGRCKPQDLEAVRETICAAVEAERKACAAIAANTMKHGVIGTAIAAAIRRRTE